MRVIERDDGDTIRPAITLPAGSAVPVSALRWLLDCAMHAACRSK